MPKEFIHELISAYVDGEVTQDERHRVESLLASDVELRQFHEELLALRDGVRRLPRHQLPESFAQGVLGEIERRAVISAGPLTSEPESPVGPSDTSSLASSGGSTWQVPAVVLLVTGAIAALVLLMLNLGVSVPWKPSLAPRPQVAQDRSREVPTETDATVGVSPSPTDHMREDPRVLPEEELTNPAQKADLAVGRTFPDGRERRGDSGLPPAAVPAELPDLAGLTDRDGFLGQGGGRTPLNIMFAVHVVLSARGMEQGTFLQVLDRQQIPRAGVLPFTGSLVDDVLSSGVFGGVRASQLPLERTPGSPEAPVGFLEMHFVVGGGEQINDVIDDLLLRRESGEVVAVKFDLLMGEQAYALETQLQRSHSPTTGVPEMARAHPLAVSGEAEERLWKALRQMDVHQVDNVDAPPLVGHLDDRDGEGVPAVQIGVDRRAIPAMAGRQFPALFILRSEDEVRAAPPARP